MFTALFLEWWSSANLKRPNQDIGMYLGVYCMLGVLSLLSLTAACWSVHLNLHCYTTKITDTWQDPPSGHGSAIRTGIPFHGGKDYNVVSLQHSRGA